MKTNSVPFSIYSVPMLGLMGLLVCLWHPQVSLRAAAAGPETVYLVNPSPELDKSMTVFLRQEAKNVAYSRRHDAPAMQVRAVADYNLIAQECTPAVFQATHLPPSLAFCASY
jgi:hypothetical protein